VHVEVGINNDLGGVGVSLKLSNNRDPQARPLNILESRSAAGCGWQTSFLLRDDTTNPSQVLVFNQAAGNSVPYQWGYHNDYAGLAAFHWNPVASDHYHPILQSGEWGSSVATSPIGKPAGVHPSFLLEDGKLHIGTGTVNTSTGAVVDLTNQYSLRSRYDQRWNSWFAEQAFYLNKKVARDHELRVYLRGATGAWSEGPIRPYNEFAVRNGSSNAMIEGVSSTTSPLSYALFVWNVFGDDIGLVIVPPNESCYGHLNMARGVYGPPHEDKSGTIDWHTVIAKVEPAAFPKGAERAYQARYLIGSPDQLVELGYPAILG
jgi:hypothetical protein